MAYLGLVLVLNSWFWLVVKGNLGMAVLLLVSGWAWFKGMKILVWASTMILLVFQFSGGIDPFWRLEQAKINEWQLRAGRYPESWVGTMIEGGGRAARFNKLTRNLMEAADINNYFFAGHPTERVGVVEFEKFHFFFLPLFLAGISNVALKRRWGMFTLVVVWGVLGILGARGDYGALVVFPVIAAGSAEGLKTLFAYAKL